MSVIEETVTALWRRGLNTYDIADRTRVAETDVCRIIAQGGAQKMPISKRWAPSGTPTPTPRKHTDQIVTVIAESHGFTLEQILSPRRDAKLVTARYEAIVAVYLACPDWSYPRLGRYFRRDHTTIMYALRKVAAGPIGEFIQSMNIELK